MKPQKNEKTVVRFISGLDRQFLTAVILLLCIGTITVFSASYANAAEYKGDSYYYAKRQILWALLGIITMTSVAKLFDYRIIQRFTKVIFAVALFLMVAVLFIGQSGGGAQRWIYIGPISVQPSEIMKFAVVLLFADYIPKYSDKITAKFSLYNFLKYVIPVCGILLCGVSFFFLPFLKKNIVVAGVLFLIAAGIAGYYVLVNRCMQKAPDFYYGIAPYVIVLGVVGVLMYLQPHISGLVIIAAIIFFMMLLGGTNWAYLGTGAVGGVLGILFLATTLSHSSTRLKIWKNPFAYLQGDGWQPAQSLFAIGSGGFWGVGFGNSRQKHLYLPEPQNDYIFSIWCEEMGFIGALIVISIFVYFIYRGVVISLRAPDKFSSLLVMGIVSHVGLQVMLNIAVVTNTLPSTGIALPFFSYGGSSLLILMAEMGVVLSVSRFSSNEKN